MIYPWESIYGISWESSIFGRIFHCKPSSYWGSSIYGNLHIGIYYDLLSHYSHYIIFIISPWESQKNCIEIYWDLLGSTMNHRCLLSCIYIIYIGDIYIYLYRNPRGKILVTIISPMIIPIGFPMKSPSIYYPLVMTNSSLLKRAIQFVNFPTSWIFPQFVR